VRHSKTSIYVIINNNIAETGNFGAEPNLKYGFQDHHVCYNNNAEMGISEKNKI
jgi:hypothetical protein